VSVGTSVYWCVRRQRECRCKCVLVRA